MHRIVSSVSWLGLVYLLTCRAAAAQSSSVALPPPAGAADCDPPISRLELDARAVRTWAAGGASPRAPGTPRALGSLGVSTVQAGGAPEGDAPGGMTFTPDGSQILIAHW